MNILKDIPDDLPEESFKDILSSSSVRIERILSKGHTSPESGWYDQDENEWVIVLEGQGTVLYENGDEYTLSRGDFLNIPIGTKHKVSWTDPENVTIWLAVFYK